jgi:signal transduction histidine kinase
MSFRLRLVLAFLAVVAVPLALLAVGVRREVAGRLSDQYRRRIVALAADVTAGFARESRQTTDRLAAIRSALEDDTRFRLAAVQGVADHRTYLLDYAAGVMRSAGLDYLQVQDQSGRVLSSGHFPAEYDRLDPETPAGLARLGGAPGVVRARAPGGPFLAFARVDSVRAGGRWFSLAAGVALEPMLARLASDPDLLVAVVFPDTVLANQAEAAAALDSALGSGVEPAARLAVGRMVERSADVPLVGLDGGVTPGRVFVAYPVAPLAAVLAGADRWFLIAGVGAAAVAVAMALALSAAMSRPLGALARVAENIDLERGDVTFASSRTDELGVLARLLGTMMGRLRADAVRVRDAERRAATGDLARQVNHDVKNGLAPVRNVFRHLDEVARDRPAELAAVFHERRGTIESGITYLERLAGNYARLAPATGQQVCDVNALVREVAAGAASLPADVRVESLGSVPPLRTDPLALRRIVENLVRNAVESLDGGRGAVRLATEARPDGVRIRVADSGRGMSREELERAFEPFYTTKPTGSGLGLSIVRRLVADLGGTLKLSSEPGRGTEAVVELPAARRA